MTSVFVGGSRDISRLNDLIKDRIKNIVSNDFTIHIGDANGADKAVQQYLFETHYLNVIVYCTGSSCRNNIGHWPVNHVSTPNKLNGLKFYMQKDLEMAKKADHGFMLWDGKSAGTLNNILTLLKLHKKCLVYFSPVKSFFTIHTAAELEDLLQKCSQNDLQKIDAKIHIDKLIESISLPEQLALKI